MFEYSLTMKNIISRDGEMDKYLKCLPYKYENSLNLGPLEDS